MARFKYVPQEYNNIYDKNENLINNESMLDSEAVDIAIKIDELEDTNIKNTLVVYDDYKIPLDITEILANELGAIQNKIKNLYDKIIKINNNIESATKNYNSFENKVFGCRQYLHDYHSYSDMYTKYNVNSVKDNGNSKNIIKNITTNDEINISDYIKKVLEYNRELILAEGEVIDNINTSNFGTTLNSYIESYKKYDLWSNHNKWVDDNNKYIHNIVNATEGDIGIDTMKKSIDAMFGNNVVDSIIIYFDNNDSIEITIDEEDK